MTPFELFLVILLVSSSGLLACSEIALFSLSRFQLRQMRDHFKPTHKRVKILLSDPTGVLFSILVTNEIINVALSALIAQSVARRWSDGHGWFQELGTESLLLQTLEGLLITGPIFLFLCEVTPKAIGATLNQVIAPFTTRPLIALYVFFTPIRSLLSKAFKTFAQGDLIVPGHVEAQVSLEEEEILTLMEEAREEGTLDETEVDLIRNVFTLDDTRIEAVSIPLSKVFCLSADTTLSKVFDEIPYQKHSRIPLVSNDKKEITGILYRKDLIVEKFNPASQNRPVHEFARKPLFVSSTAQLSTLFRKMKTTRIHLAVVQNEQNETIGIVTLRDLLFEIFEELFQRNRGQRYSGAMKK